MIKNKEIKKAHIQICRLNEKNVGIPLTDEHSKRIEQILIRFHDDIISANSDKMRALEQTAREFNTVKNLLR